MVIDIKNLPGTYFTYHQLILWLEGQKCCHCDKKATYLPKEKEFGNISYCDEHWPFKDFSYCKESGETH
jgi:hypothetical protein